jgi:hypothetical protein
MSTEEIIYTALAFAVGYFLSPNRRVLSELRDVCAKIQVLESEMDSVAKQHYAAGFSQCAKYVAQTYGQGMSDEQLTDILNEVKRVYNVCQTK